MLILTRRAGETLRIGDDIEVTVMAINGSQVRIGINAPRDVAVDREEIAERKRRDEKASDHPDGATGASSRRALRPAKRHDRDRSGREAAVRDRNRKRSIWRRSIQWRHDRQYSSTPATANSRCGAYLVQHRSAAAAGGAARPRGRA